MSAILLPGVRFNKLYPEEEVRALSWKQPFGHLMVPPFNKIETRTWHTDYRGWVLLCASNKPYNVREVRHICGDEQFERLMNDSILPANHLYWPDTLGKAFAVSRLVDCYAMRKEDEDRCYVRYREPWTRQSFKNRQTPMQLYCHRYENVTHIKPFPFKGKLGWTILTPAQIWNIEGATTEISQPII